MIGSEMDVLECRLREYESWDMHHVVVEANVTHRGVPKPLHYAENRARFTRHGHRITHVVADLPDDPDPWVREHAQRDAAMEALEEMARPSDLVLIADADEFPSAAALRSNPVDACALSMRLMMYAVDWEYPERHLCSVLARWRMVQKLGSLSLARDGRYTLPVIRDGGFHLTWLGGIEAQRAKLATICHTEMTPGEAERISSGACYREGIHHAGDFRMVPVDVDATWPRMVWERECPPSWFRPRDNAA